MPPLEARFGREPAASLEPGPNAEKATAGVPCGALDCLAFATPKLALEYILKLEPRVLGVGEAHARQGTAVDSTAKRFAELLPTLRGASTDIVIELLSPVPGCQRERESVVAATRPVTAPQAATNRSEFLELGHAAKALGIVPHALSLTCERAKAVAAAGEDGMMVLLETIAHETTQKVTQLLAAPNRRLILAYGGALHNDLTPRAGRESWSFGPELSQQTSGAYVELDLIVPEFVRDTESWRAFGWYAAFAAQPQSSEARLYRLDKRSFTLVFPSSDSEILPGSATKKD